MNTKDNQKMEKGKNNNLEKKSSSKTEVPVKSEIFNVGVTNETKQNILEYIFNSIQKSTENYYIVTPNPEILMFAMSHPDYQTILNKAKLALCDGVGLVIAGRLLGKPFTERFTGVDFVEMVCEKSNVWPITVGFLGGRDRVAEQAAECLLQKYPQMKVRFIAEEWGEDGFAQAQNFMTSHGLAPEKNDAGSSHTIDILFVAYGFPKQEQWMAEHIDRLPVRVMVGVGGAFDYISGKVRRAPKPVRAIGFEWLFRLMRQPWRLRRQLALLSFIRMTLATRFARA